ncbi:MAG TPA: hypothetical protein VF633_06320 [Brevundimonas sp.]|jgi:hypothetical protein
MNGLKRPEPPTIGALAELLAMDGSTVKADLKPLERAASVTVVVDENDQRRRRVALTDAGPFATSASLSRSAAGTAIATAERTFRILACTFRSA